jgi:hypothetical protein
MEPKKSIEWLFRNLKTKNKWDSWNLIFRIMDAGHAKLSELEAIGAELGYDAKLIKIRREQYLDKLDPMSKKYKKRYAGRRLKSDLKSFCK